MSVRSAIARVPGARRLARVLGLVHDAPGFDDRPTPEVRRDLARLRRANRFSRTPAVDAATEAVVVMTTHGARIRDVHLALESIARGDVRPRRLMLWLDDPSLTPTRALRRLQRRGLEVLQAEPGLRVHTKIYPYAASLERHDVPMATSDDDIVYPPGWLSGLLDAARRNPGAVQCYRAHRIEFDGERIASYSVWGPVTSTAPSLRTFGTSVSGQLVPPAVLDLLREAGTAFRAVSPNNDDIWMHRLAVSAGIPFAQVADHPQHFPFVPGTQATGLYLTNWGSEGNDAQIAATYDDRDTAALRAAG